MSADLKRLVRTERWIAWVRFGAVPFAVFQVAVGTDHPSGYEARAWGVIGALALGAVAIFWLARQELSPRAQHALSLGALLFDTAVVSAFVLIYHFESGTPIRQAIFAPLVEAAVRYGVLGTLVFSIATAPVVAAFEWLRSDRFAEEFREDFVTFQIGINVLVGLIVGWLVNALRGETERAEERAREAEELRDQLGRRADLLDAANRCARALASSLEQRQAFGAFIRELRGLVPFDRATIALGEAGHARIMATAGAGEDVLYPPGSALPPGSLLEEVGRHGEPVYRRDMSDYAYPEEPGLVGVGLRSRIVAPLLVGPRSIGVLAVVRTARDAFAEHEIELVTLLGRLVATAVQNIRAYEAERKTVDELRRLSALRADFVSLVSHELRSPMAAVIGAARTLQGRWRELTGEQRSAFLALIADETDRLAALIGDVLDTSRIEAGTFSYAFRDVDVAELVRETVSAAALGREDVTVAAHADALPSVRADRERLRQVLDNLIDNAIKYSPTGNEIEVSAWADDGKVKVAVRDHGPGIPHDQHRLIFEKFGRANVAGVGKPGTGLGLFIARSIAEAHGGSLEVDSAPGHGATFTLALPI
jgi:signal transduction histidine kinase